MTTPHADDAPSEATASWPGRRSAALAALVLLAASVGTGCLGFQKPGTPAENGDGGAGAGAPSEGENGSRDPGGDEGPTRDEPPKLGAWLGTWPSGENDAIARFNDRADARLEVVDVLLSWNTTASSLRPTLSNIASSGAQPLVTWNPTNLTTDQIAGGSTEIHLENNETVTVDAYVRSFADEICGFADHTGTPVLLEPMPEPNGNWHAWSVGYETPAGEQPNTNASYQEAWRHVRDVFTERCPDGATFVWTVNGANRGPGTSYMGAFPGEEHVDKAGIRGLNLGSFQDRGWAGFGATYGHAYCNVTQETDLDVQLTAVGSVEEGGDKARWIREAFRNASSHAWHRVTAIVWYHDELTLASGEVVDLSLDSSSAASSAYAQAAEQVASGEIPDGEQPPC